MENPTVHQIVCPSCKKTISNNAVINEASSGEGDFLRHIVCDCGERISYWQITAQLRGQNTFGSRFHNWVQTFSKKKHE